MSSFYDQATAYIETDRFNTDSTRVTTGFLQGEILSPTLFSLFLSDLDEFLLSRGCRGVSLNFRTLVRLLAYADDIVLLADTPTELRKLLDALHRYCEINMLEMNTSKTQILQFRRGNRTKNNQINFSSFGFGSENIVTVPKYTYLGTIFSDTCNFSDNLEKTICNTNIAIGSTIAIIRNSKLFDWSTIEKLCESLIVSVLLYSAQVWSLDYLERIGSLHISFYKR